MDVLFLCGVFAKENEAEVIAQAKKSVEFSANQMQLKLISGLKEVADTQVISAPFIGHYPNQSRSLRFSGFTNLQHICRYVSFNNIWGFRNLSRARALKKAVRAFALDGNEEKLIIVYSAHDPFLAAAAYAKKLREEVFPDLRVCLLHGKMKPKEKEKVMADFAAGNGDILVATTVVEVGVDVPNATCMVVENAERFGLSQLHQLRGRVGRGQAKSYCILLSEHPSEETKRRLKVMTKTNDGYKISREDLALRGPGDFFGQRQHGLPALKIADLSCDMALLDEAQQAAKGWMAQDPALEKPESGALRARIETLFAVKAEGLN